MKPMKEDSIGIDDKLLTNYFIDELINFQKRRFIKEYNQRNDKRNG
jgi:hypothetical protein